MPRRPPKKWFYDTVAAIKEKGGRAAKNAEAIAANLWHHVLSEAKKKIILKQERRNVKKRHKKKKVWTAAARKAFAVKMAKARGLKVSGGRKHKTRKKVSHKRRAISGTIQHKQVIIRQEKKVMAKRRKHSKRRHTARHMGFVMGGHKRRSHRRRSYRMHGGVANTAKSIVPLLTAGAVGAAGAVGGSMIARQIPVPAMVKPFLPIALGLGLALTLGKKNRIVSQAAAGMILGGVFATAKAFVPAIPAIALSGSDLTSDDLQALMGAEQRFLGYDNEAVTMAGPAAFNPLQKQEFALPG